MNGLLIAQAGLAFSFAHLAVIAIIIIAVAAIVLVFLHNSGVVIPGWVSQIAWILVIAVVAILAIKFLLSAVG